ncbi:hypothetical protein CBR64_07150 [Cellulosimicrobium cellulans]|uniref:Uncharacterized protein n=1 Tax=Cellulosimicrobium cellulans TaxID=1710 RepID=A0A1Y0HT01_CELCE|nr:hypothetical protein CBR64_07150 [Cellulosimicrobium cellulans]
MPARCRYASLDASSPVSCPTAVVSSAVSVTSGADASYESAHRSMATPTNRKYPTTPTHAKITSPTTTPTTALPRRDVPSVRESSRSGVAMSRV